MALDGAFLYLLTRELSQAVDTRVEKIYQPSKDELVFLLRKAGFHKRLLCSARQNAARVHFTETNPENPPVPPMFCMLMRKILGGAKITEFKIEPFERVLTICFSATNEMGDKICPRLVVELTGAKSNIILLGDDGRIVDAVRRSDIQLAERMVQPGATYTPPPRQHKSAPLGTPPHLLLQSVLGCNTAVADALLQTVDGVSPLVARELAYRANAEDTLTTQCSPAQSQALLTQLEAHCTRLQNGVVTPTLLCRENGTPTDFCYMPITQYGNAVTCVPQPDLCRLLDAFFAGREAAHRLQTAANDVYKLVNNLLHRAIRKNKARKEDLEKCQNRERYRLWGELLKVNLHAIEKGATRARVVNYYDPRAAEIDIPLNAALSPAANAANYFKEYKKLATAEQMLRDLIADSEAEQQYLESVAEELSRAKTTAGVEEIRNELVQAGYIRNRNPKQKKAAPSAPLKCRSCDGYEILIGRNNLQNDQLTLKTANREDLWFHTKGIHGAHVILKTEGATPSDEAVLQAAAYAAFYSKAAASSQVPVDYTRVRYVKKPSGARPGMVIYTNQKTVYVTPQAPEI